MKSQQLVRAIEDPGDALLRRLLSPKIKLILIKGFPGTGKTTLATKLLEFVESGAYISTRVGIEKLADQNPKLMQVDDRRALDTVSFESGRTDFEDIRLASATVVVEQVMKACAAKRKLIILDAWDTVAKEMDKLERLKTEKSIAAIVDSSESKLVFISEEPELTTTEYLVDAVVRLTRSDIEGRRIREITWEKLRGELAPGRSSLFTMEDGGFTLLSAPVLDFRKVALRRMEPIPDTDGFLSTGSPDLDRFLGGGMRRGMILLIEDGQTVGNEWHRAIFALMRANFLLNGGSSIVVPGIPVTPQSVVERTEALVGEELTRSRLRVISYAKSAYKHPSIVDVSGKDYRDTYDMHVSLRSELTEQQAPCLWIVSINTYETYAEADRASTVDFFAKGMAATAQLGNVCVILAKPGTENIQVLSDNCDVHLKIEERDGQMVCYSKRPPSDLYSLTCGYEDGFPRVSLRQMV